MGSRMKLSQTQVTSTLREVHRNIVSNKTEMINRTNKNQWITILTNLIEVYQKNLQSKFDGNRESTSTSKLFKERQQKTK